LILGILGLEGDTLATTNLALVKGAPSATRNEANVDPHALSDERLVPRVHNLHARALEAYKKTT